MPLTEIWSREAALEACCDVVRACVPELGDPPGPANENIARAVYQGDLDGTRRRPSCRVYQVSEPNERAWTDEQQLSEQRQAWLLTVKTAVGEVYAASILGAQAAHVAILGDTPTSIRSALIVAASALGKPVDVSPVAAASLRIRGLVAGQHLTVTVSPNITRELEADNLFRQNVMPSFWVARFEFEEQPGVNGSKSRAPDWATRLRGYLQAGLADEVLRATHIDFNTILLRTSVTLPDRGKTTITEILDVQFSAIQGLGHDVPSIESFGTAPAVKVNHAS